MDFSIFVEISSNLLKYHQISSKFHKKIVEISSKFVGISSNIVKMSSKFRRNVRFQGLPAGCVCVVAACGASATSEKTRPWIFGACILWILSIFVGFIENGTSFTEKCVKFTKPYSKISFGEFASRSPLVPPVPPVPPKWCHEVLLGPRFHTRRGSG